MTQKDMISAIDFINEYADDTTKLRFELDDLLYDISLKIFDYRMQNDLSQKELAKKLEVTQAMVSKLESGQYNPTVEQLWKISKRLNLNLVVSLQTKEDDKTEVWDTQEYKLGNIEENKKLMECS
ncbi:helix-turn-helix domain-containing protein [Clostridium algidicarnis]|uniref:Helix-turn-helix protein n=1 Tax=Clostridium algidicarnis DSM 15099 TaxID=1121295 RepID=A0A2S6FXS4_9CLOT|nr:helix-turn-helix transcriptional regulator [Clostridium algidicarnis]MBU3210045.1 helix-turn-helix domain-containing protein [Clostridium algidicarnis]PPK48354.1 helix-turn-helix protein [Clostridium algidicarnis DSM 15099]